MKLAFYYHIPVYENGGLLFVPSYLGVFLDALANEVATLYLVMHQCQPNQIQESDYQIQAKNVVWISLGLKTPAWHRTIFFKKILQQKLLLIEDCDVLIVRSPSPLAPFFNRYLKHPKLCFMIVGDYSESVQNMNNVGFRDLIIKQFLKFIL